MRLAWRCAVERDNPTKSKDLRVSASIEASELLHRLAGVPAFGGGNVKSAIRSAHAKSGMTFSRVRKLWYCEARAILSEEMDELRRRVARILRDEATARGKRQDAVLARISVIEDELSLLRERLALDMASDAGRADNEKGKGR